jgi:hypothetical protein
LNQAVGKCGFAVVNMSDDAKVSNVFHNSLYADTISLGGCRLLGDTSR